MVRDGWTVMAGDDGDMMVVRMRLAVSGRVERGSRG